MSMKQQKVYLCIDPGLKNCGAVILRQREGETEKPNPQMEVLWSMVGDVSGKVNPDITRANDMGHWVETVAMSKNVSIVLVEYQPPLRTKANPALVRWNSWIEGFWFGFLSKSFPVKRVFSNAIKRRLGIASGMYHINKGLAMEKAREHTDYHIKSDHEADCVLMAVHHILTQGE